MHQGVPLGILCVRLPGGGAPWTWSTIEAARPRKAVFDSDRLGAGVRALHSAGAHPRPGITLLPDACYERGPGRRHAALHSGLARHSQPHTPMPPPKGVCLCDPVPAEMTQGSQSHPPRSASQLPPPSGSLPCPPPRPSTPYLLASLNVALTMLPSYKPYTPGAEPQHEREVPPPPVASRLTAHQLVGAVHAVGEGVALLLDEHALAAGAPELAGQADGCKEGPRTQRGRRARRGSLPRRPGPTSKVWVSNAERTNGTLSMTGLASGHGKSILRPPLNDQGLCHAGVRTGRKEPPRTPGRYGSGGWGGWGRELVIDVSTELHRRQ